MAMIFGLSIPVMHYTDKEACLGPNYAYNSNLRRCTDRSFWDQGL